MNLHEYQAKELLVPFGVPVLPGLLARTRDEAKNAAAMLGGPVVLKAQVHAGGRGKAGGVKVAQNADEAFSIAEKMLGMKLVSAQTGSDGKIVHQLWIEKVAAISREFYLSLLIDRRLSCVSFIASAVGGTEIEQIAEQTPEKVLTLAIPPEIGYQQFHGRKIALFFGLHRDKLNKMDSLCRALYEAFLKLDCSLLEVNPLIETLDGELICLDAKVSIDENAVFRQAKAKKFFDPNEIDPRELRAHQIGINYIALNGNIGCMVNGAGLAMATMDVIKQAGGTPANFLDVGGGATKEMVKEGFEVIEQDPRVKAIFVNIFGGIMRCDVIAGGIIDATKELGLNVPVVVRLAGTNVELGQKMLSEAGLQLITASDMADAALKVVAAARA